MNVFRMVLGVLAAGALVGCANLPAPEDIGPGTNFNQARKSLYNAGWSPYDLYQKGIVQGRPEFEGHAKRLRAGGLVEVEGCDDARGVCTFNYRQGSRCMRLTTQGDKLPEMRVTSVASDCPATR